MGKTTVLMLSSSVHDDRDYPKGLRELGLNLLATLFWSYWEFESPLYATGMALLRPASKWHWKTVLRKH